MIKSSISHSQIKNPHQHKRNNRTQLSTHQAKKFYKLAKKLYKGKKLTLNSYLLIISHQILS